MFWSGFDGVLKFFLKLIVGVYRSSIRNLTGGCCRFYPTCSDYAVEVLKTHSGFRSFWLISFRILKCHPFGGSGFDPAPQKRGF